MSTEGNIKKQVSRLGGIWCQRGNNKDTEVTEEWVKSMYRRSWISDTLSQPMPPNPSVTAAGNWDLLTGESPQKDLCMQRQMTVLNIKACWARKQGDPLGKSYIPVWESQHTAPFPTFGPKFRQQASLSGRIIHRRKRPAKERGLTFLEQLTNRRTSIYPPTCSEPIDPNPSTHR